MKTWLKQWWSPKQSSQPERISNNEHAPAIIKTAPEIENLPSRKTCLNNYFNYLKTAHGRLNLKGLLHGHIPQIAVNNVYIALKSVAGEGQQEERHFNLLEADRYAARSQYSQENTATQVLETNYYQQQDQIQHTLDVSALFIEHSHLVFVGEPGSGKTTLLKYLLLELLNHPEKYAKNFSLLPQQPPIPLFITLRDLRIDDLPTPEDFSNSCVPEVLSDQIPHDFFRSYLIDGACVLFFDGLDEITLPQQRRQVSSWISDIAKHFQNNRYLVTSRIIGYREAPLHESFYKFRLCEFDKEDVRQFVTRWQTLVETSGENETKAIQSQRIEKSVEKLLNIMRDSPGIQQLAPNPLLLTIILLVYNSRVSLPQERARLYDECINVLLDYLQKSRLEDSKYGAFKPTQRLRLDQQRELLKAIALWLHQKGLREAEDDIICEQILKPKFPEVGLDPTETKLFIDEIEQHSGLIVHRGSGIGFSHLTFQEYLTALALADGDDKQKTVNYLVERRLHSWWQEVIQLYAGCVDASFLIHQLMKKTDTPLQEKDLKQPKLPLGNSSFQRIIREGYFYIDKSLLIQEVCEQDNQVLLIPRPRRFGKTLNMNMLNDFFALSKENTQDLFQHLKINQFPQYMQHQGQYPVIFLTFKDMEHKHWEDCLATLKHVISKEYQRYADVKSSLNQWEWADYENIIRRKGEISDCEASLKNLTEYLYRHYNKRAIILIDEYDMPIQAAYQYGYYDEAITFFRNFLSAGLKDNEKYLEKGLLTGILRIAKESIFSGLNNLGVFSILDAPFADKFGLTEAEVKSALVEFDLASSQRLVDQWFNGYNFAHHRIYNPWSIINFLSSKELKSYWVNTSRNELIQDLIINGDVSIQTDMATLLNHESISVTLNESIVYSEINAERNAIWSFLTLTGYLSVERNMGKKSANLYQLKIPNDEIRDFFSNIFIHWLNKNQPDLESPLKLMRKALLQTRIDAFGEHLQEIVKSVLSYHDPSGTEAERVYHVFVLGLLMDMENDYIIDSNRESGLGRYDILMKPRSSSGKGIIMEFKQITSATENAAQEALAKACKQIQDKDYVQKLRSQGVGDVVGISVVFQGKKIWVERCIGDD